MKFKEITTYAILIFVAFLFSYKYSNAYTTVPFAVSSVIAIIQITLIFYTKEVTRFINVKALSSIAVAIVLALCLLSNLCINPISLSIDRWSVISSFWEACFDGKYPYLALSHGGNYPGPMPFYYIIALPFYLIGELNLLSALGYLLVFYFIYKRQYQHRAFIILYLILSVFMAWEIMTRSNIFTYTIIPLIVLEYYSKISKKKVSLSFVFVAICIGLVLSTRSVIALAYIVYFISDLYYKRISFVKLSTLSLIALCTFVLTFLPIYLLYPNEFWIMNPFIIQSGFLIPQMYILIFFIIAIALSFCASHEIYKGFYTGLALFICILIYAIYHSVESGFSVALLNDKIDISYFILCIPFLLFFLAKKQERAILAI